MTAGGSRQRTHERAQVNLLAPWPTLPGLLGCERGTPSRLLNGKAGVSANMVLALEDIGWGTAEHWMRMQTSYDLAHAHRRSGRHEENPGLPWGRWPKLRENTVPCGRCPIRDSSHVTVGCR